MEESALIRAEQVSRHFGAVEAVATFNFSLQRGEVLGLLGPNGAGKSTTLQMVCGVLAPSSGRIFIDGVDLLRHPVAAKQRLGYLADSPPVYRDMRVEEYLTHCARLRRLERSQIATSVADVIERCDLGPVRRRLIGLLSKGFVQRIGIAQAIVHRPTVVVLDEPTVGLDPLQIVEIRALIRQLGNDYGVLLSTHILPEVQMVCDRVLIINHGRMAYDGPLQLSQTEQDITIEARFIAKPTRDELAAIEGVLSAESGAGDVWYLRLQDQPAAQQVLASVVQKQWGLLSWSPRQSSIEQLFMQIVTNETEPLASASEAAA